LAQHFEIKSEKPLVAREVVAFHLVAKHLAANKVVPYQMTENQEAIKKQNPDRRVGVLWKAAFITQVCLSYRCT